MAQFVNSNGVSISDHAKAIVDFISNHKELANESIINDLKKSIDDNSYFKLLSLSYQVFPSLLNKYENKEEIESFLKIIVLLLSEHEDEKAEEFEKNIKELLSNVNKSKEINSDEIKKIVIKVLSTLYHLIKSKTMKFSILIGILKFCNQFKCANFVAKDLRKFSQLSSKWEVSVEEEREFLLLATGLLLLNEEQQSGAVDVIDFLFLYFNSFNEKDKVSKEHAESFKRLLKAAIECDSFFLFDSINSVPLIKPLKEQEKDLAKILDSFTGTSGASADFSSIAGSIEKSGIDKSKAEEKLRLVSLAALCQHKPLVTFDEVKKHFPSMKDDMEVESLFVLAASRAIMRVKINQLKREVKINFALPPALKKDDWKEIDENLNQWQKNVDVVLENLSNKKR